MQEIMKDGSRGEKKEGTIEELLDMAKESMDKEEVAGVVIFKGEQLNVDLSPEIESEIRKLIRTELKIMLEQRDPLFKQILQEIQNGKG